LVGGDAELLPPNRSQEKRWTKEIRTRLPLWINDQVVPLINRALSGQRLSARLSTEGENVSASAKILIVPNEKSPTRDKG